MPFFNFIASLILPVYAAIFAIPAAIKNSSRLYFGSIALAFSAIAFSIDPPPGVDLFKHYKRIDYLNGLPFEAAVSNIFSGYFLFDSFTWILNTLHLPKQLFPAVVVFISYYIMLSIGNNLISSTNSKTNSLVAITSFMVFLLQINFISLALGLRSTFSYVIVFYAFYYLISEKKLITFILFSFIAVLLHPSSLIPSLIMLSSFYFPHLSKFSKPIIILAVTLMVFTNLITPLVEYLDSLASSLPFYKSGSYVSGDGEWARGFAEHATFKGWIATYIIKFMPVYISILYLLLMKTKRNDRLYTSLIISILYIGIFFSYQTFAIRYSEFYIYIFSFYLIREQLRNNSKLNLYFLLIYLISLILIWITNIYSFMDIFLTSKEIFYKPLIFILTGV